MRQLHLAHATTRHKYVTTAAQKLIILPLCLFNYHQLASVLAGIYVAWLYMQWLELEVDCAPGPGSTLRSMVSQSLTFYSLLTTCECLPEVALLGLLWAG